MRFLFSLSPFLILSGGFASAEEPVAIAHRSIALNGHTLNYTALASRLPIIDTESGEAHGYIFFVRYTADRVPNQKACPITFVWNGGPGANSTPVHLLGFGPKNIKGEDDPVHPPPGPNCASFWYGNTRPESDGSPLPISTRSPEGSIIARVVKRYSGPRRSRASAVVNRFMFEAGRNRWSSLRR